MRRVQRIAGVLVMMITWLAPAFGNATTPPTAMSNKSQMVATLMKVPLSFEANQGQTNPQVSYLARGKGYTLFLTPNEAVLALRPSAHDLPTNLPSPRLSESPLTEGTILRLRLVGAAQTTPLSGLDELPGKSSYFLGTNPNTWRTNVPLFAKVMQPEVYPGIHMVYYGNQQQLEFDFVVAPGADPRVVRLNVEGAERLEIDGQGNLLLHTSTGDMQLLRPHVYQEVQGLRSEILGQYVIHDAHEVSFQVAEYDTSKNLIIDPTLLYSTYLGGSSDEEEYGIAVDGGGNAYVTGYTVSLNFPTTAGTFQTIRGGSYDAFVTKMNSSGTSLIYSTFLGGSSYDFGHSIVVDGGGNAYLTGYTQSTNFPTTAGAFQMGPCAGTDKAFITKLSPTGSALVYSTYLCGSANERGYGIAIDGSGNAYVTGDTQSLDFPTTPGAYQTTPPLPFNAFVTKLDSTGSTLLYSTYLGGNVDERGTGIAVDGLGSAYVTGHTSSTDFPTTAGAFKTVPDSGILPGREEAFVTKLDPTGAALVYSTYLGGNFADYGTSVAVDGIGSAYVTGVTASTNFPVTAGTVQVTYGGNNDAFVTKFDTTGAALAYSTYLGGSISERGTGIAVDAAGNVYVAGHTDSPNFPTTAGAFQSSLGGLDDVFLAKLDSTGTTLLYSTYLGGSVTDVGYGLAIDGTGKAYVGGMTKSVNFPTTTGAFQTIYGGDVNAGGGDGFVAKIDPVEIIAPTATFFLHGAGPNANPPTLLLNSTTPTAATPKYRDSAGIKFNGGNLWKEIGAWPTSLPSPSNGNLTALSPVQVWIGLKNSDDQGTQFDLMAEVYKNSTLVATGLARCITGVTRNENLAKAVGVTFPSFSAVNINGTSDVISLKLSARIGTNPDDTKCSGPGGSHNNAVGLRVYFDAVSRAAAFVGTFEP